MKYTDISLRGEISRSPLLARSDQLRALFSELARPGGLVVLSGPTASAKNATAYVSLERAAEVGRDVSTMESHPWAALRGVTQYVNENLLAAPDLDVWMTIINQPSLDMLYVREIRSLEEVDVLLTAAARRRTKFVTTMHTTDAAATATRMLNTGADPWKVAGALRLVQAQRKLRRLCSDCKTRIAIPDAVARENRLDVSATAFKAVGCPACNGAGYRGHTVIFQQLFFDEPTSQLVAKEAPPSILFEAGSARGMRSLRGEAIQAVVDGETTLEEAFMGT